jgi:hypothetical protein
MTKGTGNIVAALQHLRMAEDNFISFINEHPNSKGARVFQGYNQRIQWIFRDLITNPNFDEDVRNGIKTELESDILAVPEIYHKISMIPPNLREAVEFVIERILAGEELHVEHVTNTETDE